MSLANVERVVDGEDDSFMTMEMRMKVLVALKFESFSGRAEEFGLFRQDVYAKLDCCDTREALLDLQYGAQHLALSRRISQMLIEALPVSLKQRVLSLPRHIVHKHVVVPTTSAPTANASLTAQTLAQPPHDATPPQRKEKAREQSDQSSQAKEENKGSSEHAEDSLLSSLRATDKSAKQPKMKLKQVSAQDPHGVLLPATHWDMLVK